MRSWERPEACLGLPVGLRERGWARLEQARARASFRLRVQRPAKDPLETVPDRSDMHMRCNMHTHAVRRRMPVPVHVTCEARCITAPVTKMDGNEKPSRAFRRLATRARCSLARAAPRAVARAPASPLSSPCAAASSPPSPATPSPMLRVSPSSSSTSLRPPVCGALRARYVKPRMDNGRFSSRLPASCELRAHV